MINQDDSPNPDLLRIAIDRDADLIVRQAVQPSTDPDSESTPDSVKHQEEKP